MGAPRPVTGGAGCVEKAAPNVANLAPDQSGVIGRMGHFATQFGPIFVQDADSCSRRRFWCKAGVGAALH